MTNLFGLGFRGVFFQTIFNSTLGPYDDDGQRYDNDNWSWTPYEISKFGKCK